MKIALVEKQLGDAPERTDAIVTQVLTWSAEAFIIFAAGARYLQAVDELRDAGAMDRETGEVQSRCYSCFELPSAQERDGKAADQYLRSG